MSTAPPVSPPPFLLIIYFEGDELVKVIIWTGSGAYSEGQRRRCPSACDWKKGGEIGKKRGKKGGKGGKKGEKGERWEKDKKGKEWKICYICLVLSGSISIIRLVRGGCPLTRAVDPDPGGLVGSRSGLNTSRFKIHLNYLFFFNIQ